MYNNTNHGCEFISHFSQNIPASNRLRPQDYLSTAIKKKQIHFWFQQQIWKFFWLQRKLAYSKAGQGEEIFEKFRWKRKKKNLERRCRKHCCHLLKCVLLERGIEDWGAFFFFLLSTPVLIFLNITQINFPLYIIKVWLIKSFKLIFTLVKLLIPWG